MKIQFFRFDLVSVFSLASMFLVGCNLFGSNKADFQSEQGNANDTEAVKDVYTLAQNSQVSGLFVKWTLEEANSRLAEGTVTLKTRAIKTENRGISNSEDAPGSPVGFSSWGNAPENYRRFTLNPFSKYDVFHRESIIPVLVDSLSYSGESGYRFDDSEIKNVAVVFDLEMLKEWKTDDCINPARVHRGMFVEQFSASQVRHPQRFKEYIQEVGKYGGLQMEMIWVDRPLPLKYALNIWVHPKAKEKFEKMINARLGAESPELSAKLKKMIQATEIVMYPRHVVSSNEKAESFDSCDSVLRSEAKLHAMIEFKFEELQFLNIELKNTLTDPEENADLELRTYFVRISDKEKQTSEKLLKLEAVYSKKSKSCKVTEVKPV